MFMTSIVTIGDAIPNCNIIEYTNCLFMGDLYGERGGFKMFDCNMKEVFPHFIVKIIN